MSRPVGRALMPVVMRMRRLGSKLRMYFHRTVRVRQLPSVKSEQMLHGIHEPSAPLLVRMFAQLR